MKTKHTPGPWEPPYENPQRLQYSIDGGPNIDHTADPDNWVHVQVTGDRKSLAANAHLISSAPEMYAALKALAGFSLTAHVAFNFYGGEDLSLREIIDRAIAHAEGREIGMEVEA